MKNAVRYVAVAVVGLLLGATLLATPAQSVSVSTRRVDRLAARIEVLESKAANLNRQGYYFGPLINRGCPDQQPAIWGSVSHGSEWSVVTCESVG